MFFFLVRGAALLLLLFFCCCSISRPDPHSVGWTRTRTFRQSPYSKMVQDKQSQLPSSFKNMPRHRNHEELAMQIQAQIAAERVSAATEAVAECEQRQELLRRRRQGNQGTHNGNHNGNHNGHDGHPRPSTPALQIDAEIELFRTIVLREGLLGMAASLSAEVIAGDLSKLGLPRQEMQEETSMLYHLEQNIEQPGFLQHRAPAPLTLLSVLDQLRCTTVRTVEALMNWQARRLEVEAKEMVEQGLFDFSHQELTGGLAGGLAGGTGGRSASERIPFVWEGVNYLLKTATDCDFLDSVRPLRRLLGYPLIRNPFVTPFSLDQLPPDPGPPAPLLPLTGKKTMLCVGCRLL
jgi:hypothetical protein